MSRLKADQIDVGAPDDNSANATREVVAQQTSPEQAALDAADNAAIDAANSAFSDTSNDPNLTVKETVANSSSGGSNTSSNGSGGGHTMTPQEIQAAIDAGIASGLAGLNTKKDTTPNPDYIQAITSLLGSYGISGLAPSIVSAVQKGFTPDTISLIMQDPTSSDPLALAFQKRFPANQALWKAGKPVLTPAQYLNTEQAYAQVLQAHGLSTYATPDKFTQFIVNDVSPTEVNDRVSLAVDKIQNADQSTKDALAKFYPSLNQSDILGAMLNPQEGLPALQRKVQVAQIGGAALAQGLDTSVSSTNKTMGADALTSLGITQAQAQSGYGQIAGILPIATKLSDIYSTQTAGYDQTTAEQDVFAGLASAQRARKGLVDLEQGTFSGSAGTLGASYGTPRSPFNTNPLGQV